MPVLYAIHIDRPTVIVGQILAQGGVSMATWSMTPSVSNPDDHHTLRTPAEGPYRLSQTAAMAP